MKKILLLILLACTVFACSSGKQTSESCHTVLSLEKNSFMIYENITLTYTITSKNVPNELISIQIINLLDSTLVSEEFSVNLKDGTNTGDLKISAKKFRTGEYLLKWGTMHTNGNDLYFDIYPEGK